jgi:hypothetical protein
MKIAEVAALFCVFVALLVVTALGLADEDLA